jgi:hypothetical protein
MSKEAMKLALEALEYWDVHGRLHQPTEEAITAIKEALAQPEQEPVAYLVLFEGAGKLLEFTKGNYLHGAKVEHIPLYTHPPQRTEPLIGCVNHDCAKCKEKKND